MLRTRRRSPSPPKKGRAKPRNTKNKAPVPEEEGEEQEEFGASVAFTSDLRRKARDILALLRETILPRNVKLRSQLGLKQRAQLTLQQEINSLEEMKELSEMAQEVKVENLELYRAVALAVESLDSTVTKDRGAVEVLHAGVFELMNARHPLQPPPPPPPPPTPPVLNVGGHFLQALGDDDFNPFVDEELAHAEKLRLEEAMETLQEDDANKAPPMSVRRKSSVLKKEEKETRRESVKLPVTSFHHHQPTAAQSLERLKTLPTFMQPKILLKSKRAAGIERRNVEEGRIAATTLAAGTRPAGAGDAAVAADAGSVRSEIRSSRSRPVKAGGEAGQASPVPGYMAGRSQNKDNKLPLTKRVTAVEESWSDLARFSSSVRLT